MHTRPYWFHFPIMAGLTAALVLAGCKEPEKIVQPPPPPPNYWGELPPGEKALVKLDPSMYPDFSPGFDHKSSLEQAALYSRQYLEKRSSQQFFPYLDITHERAIVSIDAFIDVLRTAQSGAELDQMIKQRFEVYQSRGYPDAQRSKPPWKPPDTGILLFTGYYRPIFDARLQPDAEFRYPLFKKPKDLVLDPISMRYGRSGGGAYYTRAEIEHGALRGQGLELCYLRDPFETYIVTVQGSGRLRLGDGRFFDIGYAGDNGHEYTSIAQELVRRGEIRPEELSLQSLIRYFKEHPDKLDQMIQINNRYVFFTPRPGGPYGSLNVPVTPFRSIATDKQVFPRGGICFITTELPARDASGQIQNYSYNGFVMDQDTGGAIRAAGRCDVFMGTGPEVGELAGRTFAEGKLYYIFLKPGAWTPPSGSPPPANTRPRGNTPPAGNVTEPGTAIEGSPTPPPIPAPESSSSGRAPRRQRLTSELPPS